MDLITIGKTVAKFAPLLGSVLPIPGGEALGTLIASAFGGDVNNPTDLISKISQDPDAAVKLKQIESNERIEIERIAVDKIRAGNEDRISARNREIETKDNIPGLLAKIFTIGYLSMVAFTIIMLKFVELDAVEEKVIELALMGLTNAEMLILAYYYGASNR